MAKLENVADYILYLDDINDNDGIGISNLKIQKLVYYCQGFYCAIFNKPFFDDEIVAWRHGPVVESLYHKFKQFANNKISINKAFDPSVLNDDEKELVEEVYSVFGQFTAWKLRDMTHDEPTWLTHESHGGVIPIEDMQVYFKTRLVA